MRDGVGQPAGKQRLLHMIGNAHIDPVWLWQWPEGYQVDKSLAQLPSDLPELMVFYGVGNHGGGPTRANLDSIRRLNAMDGLPRLECSSPRAFFDRVVGTDGEIPVHAGELQHHCVGCYSAHSAVKRWNRRAENLLQRAEKWALVADVRAALAYPLAELTDAWKLTLFNQFHDTLAGTAIAPAYEDSRDQLGHACSPRRPTCGRTAGRRARRFRPRSACTCSARTGTRTPTCSATSTRARCRLRARSPGVSGEHAADLAAWGLHRWHYRSDPPVLLETAAFDREALGERGDRKAMHVSWVSGAPHAYALLRHGRRRGAERYVAAAASVLDHIAENLAPGGTFWGQWTASEGWRNGWHPDRSRLHARTLGDATLFLLRAAVDEAAAGQERPAWEAAVRSNLDVACVSQRRDGALGAAHHAQTGEVLSWEGTAGLAWVAPLAEAAVALAEPRYLDAARRAGSYFGRFVEAEFLYGAPEDVDLAPTSEDGYVAVVAYVALHERDGAAKWLATARRAADWMLTFRYTYDVSFSPHTLLGKYGFRTRGADQASPANQHLHAFGLICLPELVRLARSTGDPYYLESARENFACFRQFIAREDGDFDTHRGMASERYYQTVCFQAKGMLLTLSHAWSVGVLLYGCEAAAGLPELAEA